MIHKFFFHPVITPIRHAQFLLACFVFFYVALLPASDTPSRIPSELLHFSGNFLLIGSAWVAFIQSHSLTANLKQILIVCAVLSVCSELAQGLTESRITDPIDFVFNGLGLGVGLLVGWMLNKVTRR